MQELEKLEVYNLAMKIGELSWNEVSQWDSFSKYNHGTQLVSAADSIANNISEGYGRYHFKENKQFCYYARGSMFETYTELTKAKNRNLVSEETYLTFLNHLSILKPKLNAYIKSIGLNYIKKETNE